MVKFQVGGEVLKRSKVTEKIGIFFNIMCLDPTLEPCQNFREEQQLYPCLRVTICNMKLL